MRFRDRQNQQRQPTRYFLSRRSIGAIPQSGRSEQGVNVTPCP
jgi:hypothetical protein